MRELLRGETQHEGRESEIEPADERVDLEAPLVNEQRRRQVDKVLEELPRKDRELLRMVFLEERDKREVCKRFKVTEEYLRVLLYRAKLRFRSCMRENSSAHV
jgi:RNA polymerase sigma factor (sigma-70 family)